MKQYIDRWSTEPSGKPLKRTENDLAYLRLFNRTDGYKLLTRNWVQAFFPDQHPNWVRTRIAELTRKPHAYLGRKTFNGRNINEIHTYYLAERGIALLGDDRPPLRKQDEEQALIDLVDASIELGARKAGVEMRKWGKILQHPDTPEHIKTHPHPFVIKVNDVDKIIPDGRPFVLKNATGAVAFFKEVDRKTEPLTSRTKREHIQQKFDNYKAAWGKRAYKTQYGFPNAMVLFVTTGSLRMQNMMQLLGPCPYILFKTIEDFTVLGLTPPVTTRFLDEPWERSGFPPFSLKTLSEV